MAGGGSDPPPEHIVDKAWELRMQGHLSFRKIATIISEEGYPVAFSTVRNWIMERLASPEEENFEPELERRQATSQLRESIARILADKELSTDKRENLILRAIRQHADLWGLRIPVKQVFEVNQPNGPVGAPDPVIEAALRELDERNADTDREIGL